MALRTTAQLAREGAIHRAVGFLTGPGAALIGWRQASAVQDVIRSHWPDASGSAIAEISARAFAAVRAGSALDAARFGGRVDLRRVPVSPSDAVLGTRGRGRYLIRVLCVVDDPDRGRRQTTVFVWTDDPRDVAAVIAEAVEKTRERFAARRRSAYYQPASVPSDPMCHIAAITREP